MKLTSLIIVLLGMTSLLSHSQNTTATYTYFNKSYACDSLQQNAIAVIPHHHQYLVVGIYQNNQHYSAYYVRALNKVGEVEWEKKVDEGFEDRMLVGGGSFIPTSDGHFVMAATKSLPINNLNGREIQSILLIKLTENGDIVWKKNLHNEYIQSVHQVLQTADDGFVVVGYQKMDDGIIHAYIVKLDGEGTIEWDKQLRLGNKSVALGVQITTDNRYLLSGYQINELTETDMFVAKINSNGDLLWVRTYGTQEHDTGASIKVLPSGDFLMAAAIREQGIKKLYLARLDFGGEILWDKIHDIPNIANIQTALQLTEDGGFAGVAYHENELGKTEPIILFFDENGDLLHLQNIEGQLESNTYVKDMEPTSDGGYILAGYNYSKQTSWLVKTDNTGYVCKELNCQISNENEIFTDISLENSSIEENIFLQISPNPIVRHATMKYQLPANHQMAELLIYNSIGKLIQRVSLNTGESTKAISAQDFGCGIYVYQMVVDNKIADVGRFSVY